MKRERRWRKLRFGYEVCESRLMLHCDTPDDIETICPGDADQSGVFDSSDLVQVLQIGEYEDGIAGNSNWGDGDWNGDGDFDTADLVLAFQFGQYSDQTTLYPDVLAVELTATANNTYRVSVTLSSPYDTPSRYADAWRVMGPDGSVLGVRELTHDHQSEQPFTRSLSGVVIPTGIEEVTVEGRDQVSGWGGATVTVPVTTRL